LILIISAKSNPVSLRRLFTIRRPVPEPIDNHDR
jgi:hypothetical protein